MTRILRMAFWAALFLSSVGQAWAFEEIRRNFEHRAIKIHATAFGDCLPALPETCDQSGSSVVLAGVDGQILIATAAHVLDPLFADPSGALARVDLDWPFPADTCRGHLTPLAAWRPADRGQTKDDLAFVVARTDCKQPPEPLKSAWGAGEPSFGVTMHYIELFSIFGPQRLSAAFFLSDACIRAGTCFDDGLVRIQDRIEGNGSGSAVFSDDGLMGVAVKTGLLVSAPTLFDTIETCAAGGCEHIGDALALSRFAALIANALAPAKPYSEEAQHRDVAALRTYLEARLPYVWHHRDSPCHTDLERLYSELTLVEDTLKLTQTTRKRRAGCSNVPPLRGLEVRTCTAHLETLNPAVQIWSGPTLYVACKAPSCWTCDYSYVAEVPGFEGVNEQRNYTTNDVDIRMDTEHLQSPSGRLDSDAMNEFYGVVRALSRIIDGGSDAAFCLSAPSYCEPQ